MKALKDLTWDEAEPIFRAFHAGELLSMDHNTLVTTLAILRRDTLYALPPKPAQKTVVPAAFWELFPAAAQVAYRAGSGWLAFDAAGLFVVCLTCVAGFVPGDDETEIVQRPEAPTVDGWIEWKGGACPVPLKTRVNVKRRGGGTGRFLLAGCCWWDHRDDTPSSDIIAYRVVKP